MKVLPWILVCLLLGILVWMQCNPHDPSTVYTKGDTVKLRDTIVDIVLLPVKETLKRTDTVYLPILIDTTIDKTIKGDTVPVLIPITSKEYKTNDYRAIVLSLIHISEPTSLVLISWKSTEKRKSSLLNRKTNVGD